jgi:uncharacterized membrane protein YfcA
LANPELAKEGSMQNDFPQLEPRENDAKNIWKSQTTEAYKMSADLLRHKLEQRRNSARFEAAKSIASGLIVFGFFAWAFIRYAELLPRIGCAVLCLWGAYLALQGFKSLQKRMVSDAPLNPTLQSYRSELENQRDYARHIWRKAGLPFCLLGASLVILPRVIQSIHSSRLLESFLPLLVLFLVWLVVFFFVRRRRQQNLQHEIDQLRMLEKESQS